MNMRTLITSTAIVVALGGCASSGMELPDVANSPLPPRAVNAMPSGVNTTLPAPNLSFIQDSEKGKSASGIKNPNRSEMRGTTWITELDPNSEYVLPVKTTNETGTSTVQQALVTADLPIGQGSCSHKGFEAVPFGTAVAIAPFPGVPVGTEASCSLMVGGQIAKLIVKAAAKKGVSELRFKANKKRTGTMKFPQGACTHADYKVSRMVRGGPLGACTVVDASAANTATYFTLPGNTETPIVKIGDGQDARLARSKAKRLPSGELLVRVQGSHEQLVLQFPNGEYTALTRGY